MKAFTCVRILACLLSTSTFIDTASAASNDIHVVVGNVTDVRASGNSLPVCHINLNFSGAGIVDAFGIRDVRIITAVDDTGHDLRLDASQDLARRRFMGGAMSSFQGPSYVPQMSHTIALTSPSRDAHSIKVLEGEADLLFPTPENGGLVIVKDFLAHPGEAYTDPLLKKSNVTIAYLAKEDSDTTTSNKVSQAVPPAPLDPTQMSRRLPFTRRPSQTKSLRFTINDPDHRLADMTFLDAYGRQIAASMMSISPESRTYLVQNELPSNLRLYIYLATPDSIKTVPFKIENIELP
jgi:hypothetical protein